MEFLDLKKRLRSALGEDGFQHDITTLAIPHVQSISLQAKLIVKEQGVFCGGFLIPILFKLIHPRSQIRVFIPDGKRVREGQTVATFKLPAAALLAGERVMLNLVGHLSGIASLTRSYVDAVRGTNAKIMDTRKTTPLWRDLEKYAVKCGGGENHRLSLDTAILVKDNHHQLLKRQKLDLEKVYGPAALDKRKKQLGFVAIEAATYEQVWQAIKARPDIILLDNMPLNQIKGSIEFIKAAREALESSKPLIEVSGRVTPEKAKSYAELGVDRISVGSITHSAPALDLSLEVS